MRVSKRFGLAAAAALLIGVGVAALPQRAEAYWIWRGGVRVWIPAPVVALAPPPPVYYAPPRVVYAAPPIVYAPPPPVVVVPRRVWVPPHWRGGYWVHGYWR